MTFVSDIVSCHLDAAPLFITGIRLGKYRPAIARDTYTALWATKFLSLVEWPDAL